MKSGTVTREGVVIVIDGTDGAGKATQTKRLVERLSAVRPTRTMDFPRYGVNLHGTLIRECLDGKHGDFLGLDPRIASVLYGADRFESLPVIREWLAAGDVAVFDRYVSANQIHQGGKISDPARREEFLGWLDRLEHGVFGLPRPDIIVYLHVPVEISVRLARDRAIAQGKLPDEAEKNTRHQLEAQESALSIVRRLNNWVKIDCAPHGALLPPDEIHEMVYAAVRHLI